MNLKELYEGTTPKLPGAAGGIQIMSPQQFIAKSAQGEEPEPEQEVDEDFKMKSDFSKETGAAVADFLNKGGKITQLPPNRVKVKFGQSLASTHIGSRSETGRIIGKNRKVYGNKPVVDVSEGSDNTVSFEVDSENVYNHVMKKFGSVIDCNGDAMVAPRKYWGDIQELVYLAGGEATEVGDEHIAEGKGKATCGCGSECKHCSGKHSLKEIGKKCSCCGNMIKLSMSEATALPASTRELKGQELTDYLDRIRNQEKNKTDKYKLPYIHRSSVIGYYNAEGKKYDTDAIKKGLAQRPEKLLKKNEKMKHSDGAQEQFFNIGFAALVGVALDENTNEIIIVNTCPGAGSCKVDCFAMKGGKVQFAGPWLSDGRILTYLLNHPNEFFNQLTSEITKEAAKGQKGSYSVSIRWHDAGDFFSPEYMDMAFKLAQSLPNVKFYAYTKVASAAMANKPANFIINWSEGASTSQEKQIKRNDPNLDTTKNSRIVPSSLFYDLLVKDSKKNLVKGPKGQWQVIPDELPELKQRLADKYGISKNSILSYDEWNTKGKNNKSMKWNVIVAPGEPDLTANDPGVLGTLLLKH